MWSSMVDVHVPLPGTDVSQTIKYLDHRADKVFAKTMPINMSRNAAVPSTSTVLWIRVCAVHIFQTSVPVHVAAADAGPTEGVDELTVQIIIDVSVVTQRNL